ncbi:MAG: hypothetical protein ACLUFN_07585 [Eubacterium sp.]
MGKCKCVCLFVYMDYGKSKWKKKRLKILRLDGYKDKVAEMFGRAEEAVIVHHIYPSEKYPQWAYEDWNLISVSTSTHNKLENRRTGKLTELGEWLQKQIKPYDNWRKTK